jgi:hypothetical protein
MEEFKKEPMYVLVAPDGTPQLSTLCLDFPTCVGFINMLASAGLGKEFKALTDEGFKILPVKVTIVQNGDENKPFTETV